MKLENWKIWISFCAAATTKRVETDNKDKAKAKPFLKRDSPTFFCPSRKKSKMEPVYSCLIFAGLFSLLGFEPALANCNVKLREKFCHRDEHCLSCNVGPKCKIPGNRKSPNEQHGTLLQRGKTLLKFFTFVFSSLVSTSNTWRINRIYIGLDIRDYLDCKWPVYFE